MMYLKVQTFLKKSTRFSAVCAIALIVSYGLYQTLAGAAKSQASQEVSDKVAALEEKVRLQEAAQVKKNEIKTEHTRLVEMTLSAMVIVRAPLSRYQRVSMAGIIAEIAMSRLETAETRNAWISVLALESKFNPAAKSPVGARGIGQIMPATADDFAETCGFSDGLDADDLYDSQVNLIMSACIFGKIHTKVGGSVSLSLVAYNAGLYSKSLKSLESLANINHETANYLAKYGFLMEKLNK